MIPRASRLLLAGLAALGPCVPDAAWALDPRRSVNQYVVTTWQRESGLPDVAVLSLAQTRDGYLWLGTNSRLLRFDGVRFAAFGAHNTGGAVEGAVSALEAAGDGGLLIGTMSGHLSRYQGGAFTAVADWPAHSSVAALARSGGGASWVAGGNVLRRLSGGTTTGIERPPGMAGITSVVEDSRGALWFGSRAQGLTRCEGGQCRSLSRRDGLPSDTVLALHAGRGGTLWVGTLRGLCRVDGERVESYGATEGLIAEAVGAIAEDRDGSVWIGTQGGLYRFYDGRFARLTRADGLGDDDVRAVLEDREGNLWVGTANGLTRLGDGRFVTYGRAQGLRDEKVRAVVGARDGSIWLGTTTGGVARLVDGVVESFTAREGLASESVIALHETRDGAILAGTDDGRLYRIRGRRVEDLTPRDETAGASRVQVKYSTFGEDDQGVIVGASGVGPMRLHGGRLLPLAPGGPRVFFFHHVHVDTAGDVWFATVDGLLHLRGGRYTTHSMRSVLPTERVRWIAPDPDGGLWLATQGGLAHFRDGVLRAVTVNDGLPESYLRLVHDDGGGRLWVAGTASVFRLSKAQVAARLAGGGDRLVPFLYDTSDGLRTTEIPIGSNPASRGADGRLWFATAKGISVIDPAESAGDRAPRPVLIEDVVVDGQRGRREAYPPGRGDVEIEYTALALDAPHRQLFRYRLQDFDRDWVDAGPRRTAYYGNLPPGRYRFTVASTDGEGPWGDAGASLDLYLRPPFYRTGWFYATCLLLAAALVLGAHRYRLEQLRARFQLVAAERQRIAREWHDGLAQNISAVSIQLQGIIERRAHPDEVRRYAERAWRIARSSLDDVRDSIWALRLQNTDRIGLVAALEETVAHWTADAGVHSTVNVTGAAFPLPADVEWNAMRIVQQALANAVRHGQPRRIDVSLAYETGKVTLSVKDDGRGFDSEKALGPGQLHFGLLGMGERAAVLGGTFRIRSRPGEGTLVVAELPCDGDEPHA